MNLIVLVSKLKYIINTSSFLGRSILLFLLTLLFAPVYSQTEYIGQVTDSLGRGLPNVSVFSYEKAQLATSNRKGIFRIAKNKLTKGEELIFFLENYSAKSVVLDDKWLNKTRWKIVLTPLFYNLSEVVIRKKRQEQRNFRTLRHIEGMTVNAGKKSEVVLLNAMTVNKAANNARQIFSKVAGVTINESSEGGLQLNIGGRGLNPNRTANFNTRQNGYDISADVLGYPESYYTPPAEAVREIQVIRGASSLQYGTQFGGLLNFKMNLPHSHKIHLNQRLSYGSYQFMSSFTELSGKLNRKFSYYSYFNYKRGDGYRPNSKYQSYNAFVNLNYNINPANKIEFDWLKYHYLAQQAGGLTNYMFYENPKQSNRERNWFRVDWNVANLRYTHHFTEDMRASVQLFTLVAERSALGYRSYRVSQPDTKGTARDLLIGEFKNWGAEARWLNRYHFGQHKSTLLIGAKYYQSNNSSQQGAGSSDSDADFHFAHQEFPLYERQSYFDYPNLNLAGFAENIFQITDKISLTPGIRLERIRTQSKGHYRVIAQHAGVVINDTTIQDNVVKDRSIFLAGIGFSYKSKNIEYYANLSQNYRSVTFSDIHSHTPGFAIAPNISDEKGYSSDLGVKGRFKKVLLFDCSLYALYYGDKIGEYYHVNQNGGVERYRDNVGTALTYGFETLLDWDVNQTFWNNEELICKLYTNTAITGSSYLSSDVPNIEGNKVEFVPLVNFRSGIELGYKNWVLNTQLSYVSSQFAEATNQDTPNSENQYGIFGKIPAYYVLDLSASYKFNKYISLEGSLQNLTNQAYFTQRATGYPGPGIIPSPPFNFIITLSVNW